MRSLAYVIWDVTPEILPSLFEHFVIHPRWYGILFALSFVVGFQLMKRIFIRENVKLEWLDKLLMHVMVGTVAGARLGHVLFYDLESYLKDPIEIIMIHHGGLASHGAAIGNIIAIWLWSRKVKDKTVLWALDRVVITIAIAAALIRTGNLVNSEIYGEPTGTESGWAFVTPTLEPLRSDENIASVDVMKGEGKNMELEITFSNRVSSEAQAKSYAEQYVSWFRFQDYPRENIQINQDVEVNVLKKGNQFSVLIPVEPVLRHATQLFEALAYFLIFGLLFFLYWSRKVGEKPGVLFGIFLVCLFGYRFVIEFFKANQVAFEDGLTLNMGQTLSIPLVIVGLYFIFTHKKRAVKA